ncbi:hypothetical protein IWW55_001816 [Coemansia sp. RSA 2706]|nr:hypothetical protein IWW55_001816 [Coemansia sp. RSA 2706]
MDSECDAGVGGGAWDQNAHIVALFAIIGASAAGVFLPIVGQTIRGLRPMRMPVFAIQLGQFFGAGVIMATAFVHLLPAANAALSSACLGGFADRFGAWACVIALAAVFSMHSIEWWLVEAWMGAGDLDPEPADLEPRALPVLSPPVNPQVFGVSAAALTAQTQPVGFALTKHGNYAALMRSRQQLAQAQTERQSSLYSDPQFALYAPSAVWPLPPAATPAYAAPGAAMRAAMQQAKSTPELMPRSAANHTQASNAVSLRRDSFSARRDSASKRRDSLSTRRLSRAQRRQSAAAAWRQRCLSMPRLPPTTLDAGLCESLLEPLPRAASRAAKRGSAATGSSRSSRPLANGRGSGSKRTSLQAVATLGAAAAASGARSPGAGSGAASPSRLDTVPETEDAWVTSPPTRASDESAAQVFASATSAMPPPLLLSESLQSRRARHSAKRVSIPTPRVVRAAPSSCAFRSVSGAQPAVPGNCGDKLAALHALTLGADPARSSCSGSTANHGSAPRLAEAVEVRRRALATHVLELGIALYSVLVGLVLAISGGHGFVALFVAICFHQFFEGLALGTSLAELYWIKAQLAADPIRRRAASASSASSSPPMATIASDRSEHHAINIAPRPIATPEARSSQSAASLETDDFYSSPAYRHSKSRRTMASMATSFTPEPWLVNPQLEKSIAHGTGHSHAQQPAPRGASTTQPPDVAAAAAAEAQLAAVPPKPLYLVPRSQPERMPGWWKAWLSALAFCATTPVGIIIGLALHNVYEPQSHYALLLNGVLQSICTGVLVYAGLATLIIGGFNSAQVKQLPRLMQVLLFAAVYAGAAAMAALKIWK